MLGTGNQQELDIPRIVAGLQFLRDADPNHSVFGANRHRYLFRPRLDEGKAVEFERRYSVRLPEDFRRFFIELGNGGAGPFYGILGLDELIETQADYWNDLSKPFTHRSQWAGPPDLLQAINDPDLLSANNGANTADWEAVDRRGELIDEYWSITSRDGTINICEYGCNLRFILILKGPEFGRIWFDSTPDFTGYSPVGIDPECPIGPSSKWCITGEDVPTENRIRFAHWYHCWLDWACQLAAKGAQAC